MSQTKELFYVSCYPELSITMVPEDILVGEGGRERKQRAKRILFTKEVMPRRLRGDGFLGRTPEGVNRGGDRNTNPFWGVYRTSDPTVIEFLRNHEFYKTTPQDNKIHAGMKLKELDWNPNMLEKGEGVAVSGIQKPENVVAVGAPDDVRPERAGARIGMTKDHSAKDRI